MSLNRNTPFNESGNRMRSISSSADYFELLTALLGNLPYDRLDSIANVLLRAHAENQRIFLFGNGGSASLASHFACDLAKGATAYESHGRHFRAIALTDNIPMITAWANDFGYEDVFAGQLRNMMESGDIAFAISASGNSANVLKALRYARESGAYCVGLSGFQGGKMKELCDLSLVVPSDNMQMIEDVHLSVAHALFTIIRHKLEIDLLDTNAKSASAAL